MADNIKDILKNIKVMLAGMPPMPPVDAPPAEVPPTDTNVAQFPVDGGQPVFVNVSDDGIADIDMNDSVFMDEAMTMPYADGTYKVSGTNFGFTVAAGVVTAVDDADGTGAGSPALPEDMSKKFGEQFTALQTDFGAMKQQFTTHMAAFAEAKATIDKQQSVITQMLSVIEKLAATPVADSLTPPQNFKSDKAASKDERAKEISNAFAAIKNN